MSKNSNPNANPEGEANKKLDKRMAKFWEIASYGSLEAYHQAKNAIKEEQRRSEIQTIVRNETALTRGRLKLLEETKKRTICYSSTKTTISIWFDGSVSSPVLFSGNGGKYLITANSLKKVGTYKDFSNISNVVSNIINKKFEDIDPTEVLVRMNLKGKGYLLNEKFLFKSIK